MAPGAQRSMGSSSAWHFSFCHLPTPASGGWKSSKEICVLAGRRWPLRDSRQAVRKGHHLGQPRGEGKGKSNGLQNLSKIKLLAAELSLSPEPPQHKTASKSHNNIQRFSHGLNSLLTKHWSVSSPSGFMNCKWYEPNNFVARNFTSHFASVIFDQEFLLP